MIEYIGIPYKHNGRPPSKELDCWGFAVYYYRKKKGIHLPTYSEIDATDKDGIGERILATELNKYAIEISADEIQEDDLLLFICAGQPMHIGIAIDNELMIHCDRKVGSVIENFRSRMWQKRLYKVVRLDNSYF